MKMQKKIELAFVAAIVCIIMVSCGGQPEGDGHGKAPEKIELPDTYQGSPIIQAYLHLKDALVKSDEKETAKRAKQFVATFDNVDGKEVEGIRENALEIISADNLEAQREYFKTLSDLMASFAVENKMGVKLYKQHCPMAFDNAGGDWLSTTEEINNPYFGSKMLHCGVITDEIDIR